MFVQVTKGQAVEPSALRERWEEWARGLAGEPAWRGGIAGVTSGSVFVAVTCFASQEAVAGAREDRRTKASEWLDGGGEVRETGDVSVVSGTGPVADGAGFVQVMHGRCLDRRKFEQVETDLGDAFHAHRPDLLSATRLWYPDGQVTAVDCFTSEADARAGERKPLSSELQSGFDRWMALLEDTEWYDLTEPWVVVPLTGVDDTATS